MNINETQSCIWKLFDVYNETRIYTTRDTAKELIKAIGYDKALETLAAMVGMNEYDGRISDANKEYYAKVDAIKDWKKLCVPYDRIHRAYLDQIASEMRINGRRYAEELGCLTVECEQAVLPELPTKTDKQLTVLLVEPMKLPREVTIDGSLESMQKLVDGYIQAIYPFEEEVALVCNEEGKLMGLPLNRSLMMDGEMVDILVGNFFIVGAPSESESFSSLSKEQIEKYKKIYYSPEAFIRTSNGIVSIPITPKPAIKREKTQEPQQPEHTAQKQRRSVKK